MAGFFLRACFFCCALGCLSAGAEDLVAKVEATYVFHLTQFVEWTREDPVAAAAPLRIGVVGRDAMAGLLEQLAARGGTRRALHVERVRADAKQLSRFHILIVGDSEQAQVSGLLRQLQGQSVLTVSSLPGFARRGGVIGFVLVEGRVRMEVNLRAAREAGLRLSGKLLEVARVLPEGGE